MIERLAAENDEFTKWRRHLHTFPEIGFEEHETSNFIGDKLAEFGCKVTRRVGGTGVVGVLSRGTSRKSIAFRAELDGLPLTEENDVPHKSRHPGAMHACGHDGHMTMLLAAARHLGREGNFDGTIYFIFQPAEENLAGARVMLADGFMERFPFDRVFGLHNRPVLEPGRFATLSGPALASADNFGIEVLGKGGHAASPHLAVDSVLVAAQIITALQNIVSRQVNPLEAAVVSVTRLEGGSTDNAIAGRVLMRGTARALTAATQNRIEAQIRATAENIAAIAGAKVVVEYDRRYPPVYNDPMATRASVAAAISLVGADHVDANHPAIMGSDDFAYFAEKRPGSFVWIGSGPMTEGRYLHHPRFDFNDAITPLGASYWVRLAETELAAA